MADLAGLDFNPDNIEIKKRGTLLPPGGYEMCITKSDVIDNKNADGKILELHWTVLSGYHVNDIIKDFINLTNPSEMCQRIGQETLARICKAVGHTGKLPNSNMLHGVPCWNKVIQEDSKTLKDDGTPFKNNRIKDYQPISAKPAGGSATAGTANTAGNAAPATKAKSVW